MVNKHKLRKDFINDFAKLLDSYGFGIIMEDLCERCSISENLQCFFTHILNDGVKIYFDDTFITEVNEIVYELRNKLK